MRLTTKTLTVSGVREDETTFPNLIVDKIAETLEAAGFEISSETGATGFRYIYVSWNGQRRFGIGGRTESTSGYAHVRVGGCFGDSDWGSTWRFAAVSNTSTSGQSVSFTMMFFATGDTCFLDFSDTTSSIPAHFSVRAYDEDGNYCVINGRDINTSTPMLVPSVETNMNSNWKWNLATTTSYYPYTAGKCYVRSGFAIYNTSGENSWYFTDDLIAVATNASFSVGQICVIDGQQYIHITDKIFAKYAEGD